MVELSLLRSCLNHKSWSEIKEQGLSIKDLANKELQLLFSVLDNFHSANPETNVSVADLGNLIYAATNKDHEFYNGVLKNLATLDVSEASTKVLVNSLVLRRKQKELSVAAYEAYEGTLSPEKFNALVEAYKALPEDSLTGDADEFEFVSDSLQELVDQAVSTPGLRWRLSTLNRMLGSLRKGNFGFVFARPETGKTTFLASEVSFMCSQLKDEDGPIIWIANEEPGPNVKLRTYQAWFGITMESLLSDIPKWEKKFIEESKGKLKIFSQANVSKSMMEKLCKKFKPSLLIVDQLDKILGFDNDREDLRLGAIYQWARELAKMYCPTIGICQADGSGEGVKWLTMGNVANAKTSKQAEADFILGIGASNAEGYESIRYLHLSKNKLMGDKDTEPALRHGKVECLIEPQTARYRDLF